MSLYRFIWAEKANYPIRLLCRVLSVSRAAYYSWVAGSSSKRQDKDEALLVHIKAIWLKSRKTYGYPRITRELREQGFCVGKRRVSRLMREHGMWGIPKRRFKRQKDSGVAPADNVVDRQFTADAPNEVWVGDITYLPVTMGFVYLAVLIDLFSRKVVGWALSDTVDTELCLAALSRAVATREPAQGLIHHTDRGCQYTSADYQRALTELGATVSMSRKGNCWDNAVAESFFGTFEQEVVRRLPNGRWTDKKAALDGVTDYIHNFYNSERKHSTLGHMSPVAFEQAHRSAA